MESSSDIRVVIAAYSMSGIDIIKFNTNYQHQKMQNKDYWRAKTLHNAAILTLHLGISGGRVTPCSCVSPGYRDMIHAEETCTKNLH